MSFSNRSGKFSISRKILDASPEMALLILRNVFIIRAEYLFDRDCFEYTGLCEQFRELEEFELSPKYCPEIHNNEVIWLDYE